MLLAAHETEIIMGNEGFIDHIIRMDESKGIVKRILMLDRALSGMMDKQARAQLKLVREAEKLYLKAAENSGNAFIKKMILSQRRELEDELTRMNSVERNVRLSRQYSDFNIDNYTKNDYNNYGWVRANDVLTAGQMKNFEAKFAKVKSNQLVVNKSKHDEYMIPVSDIYDYESEGIEDTIVYAKGSLDSPTITRILKINLNNETDLDQERRKVYDAERRGIQPQVGDLFRFYYPTDYRFGQYRGQRNSSHDFKNHSQFGIERGRSSKTAPRFKGLHVNEDGSITYTYDDGSTQKIKMSLKNRDHDLDDFFASDDYNLKEEDPLGDFFGEDNDGEPVYKVSGGKVQKIVADNTRMKVYTRAEAEAIVNQIVAEKLSFGELYGSIAGKSKRDVIDILWNGLNSADVGQQGKVALDVAEYIINSASVESIYAGAILYNLF